MVPSAEFARGKLSLRDDGHNEHFILSLTAIREGDVALSKVTVS